jgi:hypothetical protein
MTSPRMRIPPASAPTALVFSSYDAAGVDSFFSGSVVEK